MSRIVSALVRMGSCILELLTIKERRKDRKERKEGADAPIQAADDIRHSIAAGDEAKVNQALEDARLGRTHGGRAVSVALAALLLPAVLHFSGCIAAPRPHVLSADRAVVKMELDGVSGWFVPDAQFADLSAAYVAETARMRLRDQLSGGVEP